MVCRTLRFTGAVMLAGTFALTGCDQLSDTSDEEVELGPDLDGSWSSGCVLDDPNVPNEFVIEEWEVSGANFSRLQKLSMGDDTCATGGTMNVELKGTVTYGGAGAVSGSYRVTALVKSGTVQPASAQMSSLFALQGFCGKTDWTEEAVDATLFIDSDPDDCPLQEAASFVDQTVSTIYKFSGTETIHLGSQTGGRDGDGFDKTLSDRALTK